MITHDRRIGLLDTWLYVLVCFALASLACAAKNFLSVSLQGTPVCGVLCPSIFGARGFPLPDSLDWLFAIQIGAEAHVQALFDKLWSDNFFLLTGLVVAPVLEEGLYRGPLYLFRKWSEHPLWWAAALVLTLLFALSHTRAGLALLPLLTLGMASVWLIARTRKLWPSIALHFCYNFFLLSVTVFQSLYWVD